MVCELDCSREQKEGIRERLRQDYLKRFRYHYAVPGLPFLVWGRPFYWKNQYTCSSYIARVLQENGIRISEKHFSLVTPKDFFLYQDKKVIFEGSLAELVGRTCETDRMREAVMAAGSTERLSRERVSGRKPEQKRHMERKLRDLKASERVVAVYGS